MSFEDHRDPSEAQAAHFAAASRTIEAVLLDGAAERLEEALASQYERTVDAGQPEAADWFEAALCAVRGGRRELAQSLEKKGGTA